MLPRLKVINFCKNWKCHFTALRNFTKPSRLRNTTANIVFLVFSFMFILTMRFSLFPIFHIYLNYFSTILWRAINTSFCLTTKGCWRPLRRIRFLYKSHAAQINRKLSRESTSFSPFNPNDIFSQIFKNVTKKRGDFARGFISKTFIIRYNDAVLCKLRFIIIPIRWIHQMRVIYNILKIAPKRSRQSILFSNLFFVDLFKKFYFSQLN